MDIKAIVYTSNTGYTAEYARILSAKCSLPVYTLREAMQALDEGDKIVYLGWLMAGFVKGYKKAAKRFAVTIVCAVGLGGNGTQREEVRQANSIPEGTPLFTIQGGYDYKRLRGINKFLMRIVGAKLRRDLLSKPCRSESDEVVLDLLTNGGSAVDEKNLDLVIEAIEL